jgi:GNAT superfamily N-acetyltransferase
LVMERVVVCTHRELPIRSRSVCELYDHVGWRRPGGEDEIAAVLEAGPAVGAWDGDRLVGFARALSDGHFAAYVEDVMVHEGYRGGGLGDRILARLLREIGGVGQVSLFCAPMVTRFYEGHGFRTAPEHVIMHRGEMEARATDGLAP